MSRRWAILLAATTLTVALLVYLARMLQDTFPNGYLYTVAVIGVFCIIPLYVLYHMLPNRQPCPALPMDFHYSCSSFFLTVLFLAPPLFGMLFVFAININGSVSGENIKTILGFVATAGLIAGFIFYFIKICKYPVIFTVTTEGIARHDYPTIPWHAIDSIKFIHILYGITAGSSAIHFTLNHPETYRIQLTDAQLTWKYGWRENGPLLSAVARETTSAQLMQWLQEWLRIYGKQYPTSH